MTMENELTLVGTEFERVHTELKKEVPGSKEYKEVLEDLKDVADIRNNLYKEKHEANANNWRIAADIAKVVVPTAACVGLTILGFTYEYKNMGYPASSIFKVMLGKTVPGMK